MLLTVACVLTPISVHASTALTDKTSDQRLAQLVLGIISYTQWSQLSEPVHLCVVDSAHYFNVLLPIQAQSQQRVIVWSKTAATTNLTQQCHVLFFEQTAPAQQQAMIEQRGIRRILTISLNNPSCAVGSSFCIATDQNTPSFRVNLDSLKQSGIKISSKVLALSKPQPQ